MFQITCLGGAIDLIWKKAYPPPQTIIGRKGTERLTSGLIILSEVFAGKLALEQGPRNQNQLPLAHTVHPWIYRPAQTLRDEISICNLPENACKSSIVSQTWGVNNIKSTLVNRWRQITSGLIILSEVFAAGQAWSEAHSPTTTPSCAKIPSMDPYGYYRE